MSCLVQKPIRSARRSDLLCATLYQVNLKQEFAGSLVLSKAGFKYQWFDRWLLFPGWYSVQMDILSRSEDKWKNMLPDFG